jgi:tRNA(Ile)-lysidine synthase
VALAVSGGSDSMALLRLAREWASAQVMPPRISVLTVDHGLRQGSDAEVEQVSHWARAIDFDHHTLCWEGEKPQTGLQSKARKARYDLMARWCIANDAQALVTAHTLDDQAETVLMRLSRTTSPDSLAGIPRSGHWNELPLLRPLLGIRRNALRRYLSQVSQPWIDDPSNMDAKFERVRVRNSLSSLDNEAAESLAALAERCASTVALLEKCARAWLDLWLSEEEAGICYAPISRFVALPPALQERIFAKLIAHYGGGAMQPEREELRRLTQWIKQGPVRCTLGGAVLGRRKEQFWVTREPARLEKTRHTVPESGAIIWDGRFAISAPAGSIVSSSGNVRTVPGKGVPLFARQAYPQVVVPDNKLARSCPVDIAFIRLKDS